MTVANAERSTRLPRFRRASVPPAFRLTDDDVEIVRQVARHRLIRSTHIAALVGRSLDRTNDRLRLLFHAGYVDRPRAQLDRFPTDGTAPMVYALADRGARLLCEREGFCCGTGEWSRKNREAGRPFIEHQIEIVNFEIAVRRAIGTRPDLRLLVGDETVIGVGQPRRGNPFALRAKLSYAGWIREASVVPDFVFSLTQSSGGQRFNFMVEIDRGKMPIRRSDPDKTSFEQKMRVYLSGHGARQHERQIGWKNFRVLSVTTDPKRLRHMQETLRTISSARGSPSLFLFSTYETLRTTDLFNAWQDGSGHPAKLV